MRPLPLANGVKVSAQREVMMQGVKVHWMDDPSGTACSEDRHVDPDPARLTGEREACSPHVESAQGMLAVSNILTKIWPTSRLERRSELLTAALDTILASTCLIGRDGRTSNSSHTGRTIVKPLCGVLSRRVPQV